MTISSRTSLSRREFLARSGVGAAALASGALGTRVFASPSPSPSPSAGRPDRAAMFARNMALERAFVAAGGLLIAGPDPTGNGGVLPGFGDQREVELLVEAGFTPVEAIQIATLNGATYLGQQDRIGSIAEGKNADLVVIKGNPASRISDIENVEIVFKDGVGFDSPRLFDSVKQRYGQY